MARYFVGSILSSCREHQISAVLASYRMSQSLNVLHMVVEQLCEKEEYTTLGFCGSSLVELKESLDWLGAHASFSELEISNLRSEYLSTYRRLSSFVDVMQGEYPTGASELITKTIGEWNREMGKIIRAPEFCHNVSNEVAKQAGEDEIDEYMLFAARAATFVFSMIFLIVFLAMRLYND